MRRLPHKIIELLGSVDHLATRASLLVPGDTLGKACADLLVLGNVDGLGERAIASRAVYSGKSKKKKMKEQ